MIGTAFQQKPVKPARMVGMSLASQQDHFLPATPVVFPHPAAGRELLLPEERMSCSLWTALRSYCVAAVVFMVGVLLAAWVVVQTKPPVPDPAFEYPYVKAAALRAILNAPGAAHLDAEGGVALCVFSDRSANMRALLREALPEYATTVLAEDCEPKARARHQRPFWLHVGRVSWPNRSYAVVVFATHDQGEIILHKTPEGYALHEMVWPLS